MKITDTTRGSINELDTAGISGDEVLILFREAQQPRLAEWIARYPAHARALACCAADNWGGDIAMQAAPETVAVAHVRSVALAAMQARRTATAAATVRSLVAVAAARGLDAQAVATKLDIPFALFFKLHRRLIAPDSIPQQFLTALADTLGRQADEIAAYLRQPATLAAGSSYRSDDTPTVGEQETFAVALATDPEATDAQKAQWGN